MTNGHLYAFLIGLIPGFCILTLLFIFGDKTYYAWKRRKMQKDLDTAMVLLTLKDPFLKNYFLKETFYKECIRKISSEIGKPFFRKEKNIVKLIKNMRKRHQQIDRECGLEDW